MAVKPIQIHHPTQITKHLPLWSIPDREKSFLINQERKKVGLGQNFPALRATKEALNNRAEEDPPTIKLVRGHPLIGLCYSSALFLPFNPLFTGRLHEIPMSIWPKLLSFTTANVLRAIAGTTLGSKRRRFYLFLFCFRLRYCLGSFWCVLPLLLLKSRLCWFFLVVSATSYRPRERSRVWP